MLKTWITAEQKAVGKKRMNIDEMEEEVEEQVSSPSTSL
jgi:hypothetical protein